VGEMAVIQLQVPVEWEEDLRDPAVLLEVLGLGLEEYRIRQALLLYQKGLGSLGYVADIVGIPERVLMEEARRRGVLPHYDNHFADQDLGR
jgi:predicted HTH domain antitoxin